MFISKLLKLIQQKNSIKAGLAVPKQLLQIPPLERLEKGIMSISGIPREVQPNFLSTADPRL